MTTQEAAEIGAAMAMLGFHISNIREAIETLVRIEREETPSPAQISLLATVRSRMSVAAFSQTSLLSQARFFQTDGYRRFKAIENLLRW